MAAGADVTPVSTSDMLSGIDLSGTMFDSAADTGSGDLGTPDAIDPSGASEGEEPIEIEGDRAADTDIQPAESEGEVPEEAEEEPQEQEAQPDQQAQQSEELPDGVRRGKDRNGKEGLWLTPQRYDQFHGAHRLLRDFEAATGEQMSPEALDVRQRAYMGQERLFTDLNSADPEAQGRVLDYIFDDNAQALQDGKVGTDPNIPLATTFYDRLREKSPDGYAHVRARAASDLLTEMYQHAQQTGDKNLAISASHIAKALGMPYKKDAEITEFLANRQINSDPVATLQARINSLQNQLNGRQTQDATAQFRSWEAGTRKAVTSAVQSDAVSNSLSDVRQQWEKFPTQFENLVVKPLNSAVKQTIDQDRNFIARIDLLTRNAKMATSAQVRANIAEQIKNAYVQRALQAVEAHKKGILSEAAALLKQGNDATHQRRQAAQQQRGPRGAQAPVPRSIIPDRETVNPGGVFDTKAEVARMRRLIEQG